MFNSREARQGFFLYIFKEGSQNVLSPSAHREGEKISCISLHTRKSFFVSLELNALGKSYSCNVSEIDTSITVSGAGSILCAKVPVTLILYLSQTQQTELSLIFYIGCKRRRNHVGGLEGEMLTSRTEASNLISSR